MTTREQVDCLDEETVRDTLAKVVAAVQANESLWSIGRILNGWSLLYSEPETANS